MSMRDEAILALLGERLARYRLDRNRTQAEMADEAGVSRRSIYKAESGQVVTTAVLIRLLRAYGLLERLDLLVPEPPVSPIALLEAKGRQRQRAAGAHKKADKRADEDAGGWVWPDENS
jgi:putative transcriptional regulator